MYFMYCNIKFPFLLQIKVNTKVPMTVVIFLNKPQDILQHSVYGTLKKYAKSSWFNTILSRNETSWTYFEDAVVYHHRWLCMWLHVAPLFYYSMLCTCHIISLFSHNDETFSRHIRLYYCLEQEQFTKMTVYLSKHISRGYSYKCTP